MSERDRIVCASVTLTRREEVTVVALVSKPLLRRHTRANAMPVTTRCVKLNLQHMRYARNSRPSNISHLRMMGISQESLSRRVNQVWYGVDWPTW